MKYVGLYEYAMKKDRNRLLLKQAEVSSRMRPGVSYNQLLLFFQLSWIQIVSAKLSDDYVSKKIKNRRTLSLSENRDTFVNIVTDVAIGLVFLDRYLIEVRPHDIYEKMVLFNCERWLSNCND